MDKPITLITGTRKGIGKYLAQHYLSQGHEVVGCSRSDVDWRLDGYTHFVTDVAEEKAVQELFRFVRTHFGRLDHLINNAGIASMNHTLLMPLTTFHKILNTNVVGAFLFSREAAKLMMKKGFGRIVNFTTVAVPLKLEGEGAYVASKAAVQSLTEVMAREFADFGITVNAIGPGPIKTDLIRSVPPEKMDNLLSKQAIKRHGTFEDIANVTDFFLKKESNFITGQTIFLGGV